MSLLCTRAATCLTALSLLGLTHVQAQVPDSAQIVAVAERVIAGARLAEPAPGCAVGVSRAGRSVFEGAFGMADVEFGVPITPATILESGSVSKQFVGASIVLLALNGKLDLDDPVRRYIPELPDYGATLTIRHMLNHTAGLRDWGAVMALTGVGRGERVVSQDLAFDIIIRQKGLDFTPGAEYSYSNSGYTLLTTIVERVSGTSLPDFTAEHFFTPLGMTHSSWRTDYQRLVPGRAQAYARQGNAPWHLEMPFMNVYGNGGMLTTIGDWLKWNAMLDSRSLGSALVDSLEVRGRLNDGSTIPYALGVTVGEYRGQREVAHSGSTAGYSTYLARYPEMQLSVAVMCNGGSAFNPTQLTRRIVDGLLPPAEASLTVVAVNQLDTVAVGKAWTPSGPELAAFEGTWFSDEADATFRLVVEGGQLWLVQRPTTRIVLRPQQADHFLRGPGTGATIWFSRDAAGAVTALHVGTARMRDMPFVRVAPR